MSFSINGQQISSTAGLEKSLAALLAKEQTLVPAPRFSSGSLPVPESKRIHVFPYECVYFDTHMDPDNNASSYYFHAHRVDLGVSLYFYNTSGGRLMTVLPGYVSFTDWTGVFLNFKKDRNIKLVMTGGALLKANKNDQEIKNNIAETLKNLYDYATNPERSINIDFVGAQVLDKNTIRNKTDLYKNLTPYLQNALHTLSMRYCQTTCELDLSHDQPELNFTATCSAQMSHLEAAITLVTSTIPYGTVPFKDLPNLGVGNPKEYIDKLAKIVFTQQAALIFEERLCGGGSVDLDNFRINCDTHEYCRSNDYNAVIPNLELRMARILELPLLNHCTLLSFEATLNNKTPKIALSRTMLSLLRTQADNFERLKDAQIAAHTNSCALKITKDEKKRSKMLAAVQINSAILYKTLAIFNQGEETDDQLARDFLRVLDYYRQCPDKFTNHSQLANSGFFAEEKSNDLIYSTSLIKEILQQLENRSAHVVNITVKSYVKSNLLDIYSDTNSIDVLIELRQLLRLHGENCSIAQTDTELYTLRLEMSAKTVKAISDSHKAIELDKDASNPRRSALTNY